MAQVDIDQFYKIYFESDTLDDYASNFLALMKKQESACSRLLLYVPTIQEISKKYSLGNKSDIYAYLDDEIILQLKERSKLFIPDSSKYRAIKFTPGKPYPKSILGFSSKLENDLYIFFWEAVEQEKEL